MTATRKIRLGEQTQGEIPSDQLADGTDTTGFVPVANGDGTQTWGAGATAAHIADTTDAHDASAVSVVPAGNITSTDVQAALVELDGDIAAGGIPATIVDAKGDLIAGTAADTVARLAVGTNTHVLTADSGEATGLKWAAGGSGLPFTPLTKVAVFNGSTTTSSIAKTLTAAITGVPATATMVTGWISVSSNGAANNGNYIAVHHDNAASDNSLAAICRNSAASGIVTDVPFLVACTQSSGAKIYYDVGRSANTVTYYLNVTGYIG